MDETTITVRGTFERRYQPDSGTVRFTLRAEEPERAAAVAAVTATQHRVLTTLKSREGDDAPATWSVQNLVIRSDTPWTPDGTRPAPVQIAAIEGAATFRSPAALAEWVDAVSQDPHVQIDGITWQLDDEHAGAAQETAAIGAVQDAVSRATRYANALGLVHVKAVAIADPGLLDPSSPAPRAEGFAVRSSAAVAHGIDLHPKEITVDASVEARFLAE